MQKYTASVLFDDYCSGRAGKRPISSVLKGIEKPERWKQPSKPLPPF